MKKIISAINIDKKPSETEAERLISSFYFRFIRIIVKHMKYQTALMMMWWTKPTLKRPEQRRYIRNEMATCTFLM